MNLKTIKLILTAVFFSLLMVGCFKGCESDNNSNANESAVENNANDVHDHGGQHDEDDPAGME